MTFDDLKRPEPLPLFHFINGFPNSLGIFLLSKILAQKVGGGEEERKEAIQSSLPHIFPPERKNQNMLPLDLLEKNKALTIDLNTADQSQTMVDSAVEKFDELARIAKNKAVDFAKKRWEMSKNRFNETLGPVLSELFQPKIVSPIPNWSPNQNQPTPTLTPTLTPTPTPTPTPKDPPSPWGIYRIDPLPVNEGTPPRSKLWHTFQLDEIPIIPELFDAIMRNIKKEAWRRLALALAWQESQGGRKLYGDEDPITKEPRSFGAFHIQAGGNEPYVPGWTDNQKKKYLTKEDAMDFDTATKYLNDYFAHQEALGEPLDQLLRRWNSQSGIVNAGPRYTIDLPRAATMSSFLRRR